MASTDRSQYDLSAIRSEGWFEQLGEEVPEFEQLCQVVGRRFVAFSFIASVRITSIAYDPQTPHSSLVDFTFGDDGEPQRMTLSDFRERLGSALVAPPEGGPELDGPVGEEEVRGFLGRRYILLAPIFGITLVSLAHGGGDDPVLTLELGQAREQLSLQGLRDILHNAVRSEVARSRPSSPFSIDFKKVPLAEQANSQGNYDETIALLGAWPGPLSMFLRTPQGQGLGETERGKLVRALGALGHAYVRKDQLDWAEDVLRLGIQFGQELDASGPLFGSLGKTRLRSRRYGEAIGLLRRALSLGADPKEVLPDLAQCFQERGRHVAAMVCLDRAEQAGVEPSRLAELRRLTEKALGPSQERFRGLTRSPG